MCYLEELNPRSPFICKRKKCKYHTGCTTGAKESCNYFFITGITKHSQGVTDWQECRLFDAGQRERAPIQRPVEGKPVQRPFVSRFDWDKARELYEQGKTDMDIAVTIGCSDTTVREWRKREKLDPNFKRGERP